MVELESLLMKCHFCHQSMKLSFLDAWGKSSFKCHNHPTLMEQTRNSITIQFHMGDKDYYFYISLRRQMVELHNVNINQPLLTLNYIPPDLHPENVKDFAQRLLKMKVFI